MLTTITLVLFLASPGREVQEVAVPVKSIEECVDKGVRFVEKGPSAYNASAASFLCIVSQEKLDKGGRLG